MKKPQRVLITGASSGIGAEFARVLAGMGVNLVLAARRTEQLSALALELKNKFKIEAEVVTIDLLKENAHEVLLEACTKDGKIVDMLINNAGAGPYRPFLATKLEDHLSTVNLNVIALTKVTHAFAHHMLKHKKPSRILNVASMASYQLMANYTVYCGTKFYVRTFSEILNYEMKKSNVSVSCLCPGATATEFITTNNMKVNGLGASLLMSPQRVARVGINGALKGKRVISPGVLNRLIFWTSLLLPNFLSIGITDKGMQAGAKQIS
jgi:short-subunit dehydrogenase